MFLGKNWKFCFSLFWDKMGLETISDDHLRAFKYKQAHLDSNIKIMVFHSEHI